jgi:predicted O-methyltransferase YrrM
MRKDQLEQLARESLKLAPYPNPNFPPSLYYRFLRTLADFKKSKLSVVLGVCGGGDSLHLAMGYPSGVVVGVEKGNDYADNIKYITEKFPNFIFWKGDSVESAKAIFKRFGPVDILFIDTIHTYERTFLEFNTWFPYLDKNAVVCLDDLLRVEMKGVWEDMPGEKFRADFLHYSQENEGGFGVIFNIK